MDLYIPKGFRIDDMYNDIVEGYDTKFIDYKKEKKEIWNVIGASSIPYGIRQNVLRKRLHRKDDMNNSMFTGKLIHQALQHPRVLTKITTKINTRLGLEEKIENNQRFIKLDNGNYTPFYTIPNTTQREEKVLLVEIEHGNYLRMHTDVFTPLYIIEIKTTTMPKKMWSDLAPYHQMQANLYTGFCKHLVGFLLKVDKHFITSSGKFTYIWNNYFHLYPYNFNRELFEYTIERLRQYFHYLEGDGPIEEMPCPEFVFECDGCIVRDKCKNPIDKVKMEEFGTCEACGEKILPKTTALIRNDKLYHYTDSSGDRMQFKDCIQACKNAFHYPSIT
jgi:CRISPR/Cas system-associated exonuclease Cas4 (RecB family)